MNLMVNVDKLTVTGKNLSKLAVNKSATAEKVEECAVGKLRLGRIEVDVFTQLGVLTSGKYDKLQVTDIMRKDLLSRRVSMDNEQRAERLLIVNSNTFPVINDKGLGDKKFIFEFDENYVAHATAPLNDPGEAAERFKSADSREGALMQLTADELPSLGDEAYSNGDECDIYAYNPDGSGFIAAKHDFIRTMFTINLVDVVDNKLVTRELPYVQTLYRTTVKTPNSYLAIPKTRMYIIVDVESGAARLFRNGEAKCDELANIDAVLEKFAGELRQNYEENCDAPVVDFATAELFIDTCANEFNDDFTTPCVFAARTDDEVSA